MLANSPHQETGQVTLVTEIRWKDGEFSFRSVESKVALSLESGNVTKVVQHAHFRSSETRSRCINIRNLRINAR